MGQGQEERGLNSPPQTRFLLVSQAVFELVTAPAFDKLINATITVRACATRGGR